MATATIRNEGKVAPNTGGDTVIYEHADKAMKSVVFIDPSEGGKGTGCLVLIPRSPPMLLTCHHVIPSKEVAKQCTIYFDRENDDTKPGTPVRGEDLFDLRTFTTSDDKILDFTVINLNEGMLPDAKSREMFSLNEYTNLEKESLLKEKDNVFLWHYPLMEEAFVRRQSAYEVAFVSGFLFGHKAETHGGSSGCPVLKAVDGRWVLVGLHRGDVTAPPIMEGNRVGKTLNVATSVEAIHKTLVDPGYKPQPMPDLLRILTAESTEKVAEPPMARVIDLNSPIRDHPNYSFILDDYVVDKVGNNGKKLATHLGISHATINAKYGNYPHESGTALAELLHDWIDNNPKSCWSDLIKAMRTAHMCGHAGDLGKHLGHINL